MWGLTRRSEGTTSKIFRRYLWGAAPPLSVAHAKLRHSPLILVNPPNFRQEPTIVSALSAILRATPINCSVLCWDLVILKSFAIGCLGARLFTHTLLFRGIAQTYYRRYKFEDFSKLSGMKIGVSHLWRMAPVFSIPLANLRPTPQNLANLPGF
jgi:hypothetical protein